jgi:hypothetical protein
MALVVMAQHDLAHRRKVFLVDLLNFANFDSSLSGENLLKLLLATIATEPSGSARM